MVTGSGFWKATGIDKPICGFQGCIGLKKSLVYYKGHAGKGTKTDWMMHEFRLPLNFSNTKNNSLLEAEVWTLCRIFKRDVSCRKFGGSDWQNKNQLSKQNTTSCSSTVESDDNREIETKLFMDDHNNQLFTGTTHQILPSNYISFSNPNSADKYYSGQQNWDELRPVVDYTLATSW